MKKQEKLDFKKEILLVATLFGLCGFALYQFSKIDQQPTTNKIVNTQKVVDNPSYLPGINEPLDKTIAFTELEFDASQGIEFHLPTGTNIRIPKNALVDKKGKKVTGKVRTKFREMHNAKDIFISGIPMQTDENKALFLESNGMMELRVFQGDQELKLKEGNKVDIDLAAFVQPTKDFKLWKLKQDKKWDVSGSYSTVPNNSKNQKLLALDEEKKKRKKNKESGEGSSFQFTFNSNLKNFPHMSAWNGVTWNLLLPDPNFPTENIGRIDWSDIKMEKIPGTKDQYSIELSYSNFDYANNLIEEMCKITAVPADLSKKELKAIEADFALKSKEYEGFLQLAKKEEDRLKAEASLLNKFTVSGFGVYNIDKLTDADQLVKLDMHFDFENDLLLSKNPVQLMVIAKDRNTVLNFLPSSWKSIPYLGPQTELVAALPDGSYAYVDASMFSAAIPESKLSSTFQNTVTLKTRRLKKDEINNVF
jgi:hypothetical protein